MYFTVTQSVLRICDMPSTVGNALARSRGEAPLWAGLLLTSLWTFGYSDDHGCFARRSNLCTNLCTGTGVGQKATALFVRGKYGSISSQNRGNRRANGSTGLSLFCQTFWLISNMHIAYCILHIAYMVLYTTALRKLFRNEQIRP